MKKNRLSKVIEWMEKEEIPQMIISDPVVIFYLTGQQIYLGERLLVLYINVNGNHKMLLNTLFPKIPDLGIDIVRYSDGQDGIDILAKFIEHDKVLGIDKNWPSRFLIQLMEKDVADNYVNASWIIDQVRLIKDESEKELLRISSRINDSVMKRLIDEIQIGMTEKELADRARDLYDSYGCQRVSFPPLVAFAGGASNPHHMPQKIKGQVGDCVVIDIGGTKDNYASDMTRTVFLGEVSERQREIYNIVLEANLRGIAAARSGNRMCDVDFAVRSYIEECGYGKYFTHRTGHSIGIEDHEPGDVSALNKAEIREGQCFSVEPGIYLPEENIGVRIEDLVLIDGEGCEVLNQFTKELIVIPAE